MKKKILAAVLTISAGLFLSACGDNPNQESYQKAVDGKAEGLAEGEVALVKSTGTNPMVGNADKAEDLVYGGDPSILVDGDTVYLYTGHDTSTDEEADKAIYVIREYLCYSSKDLLNWTAEGSVMTVSTEEVSWVTGSTSAWASQVIKHYDKKAGKDKYYLYYCSWDKTAMGKQSIGVAVSDSPTGPFEDIGESLVKGTITEPQNSNWDDIDPTVWVEEDENGEEHRYLGWGNSRFYICELNEDMVSVKDLNGDGEITYGTSPEEGNILPRAVSNFTEAPWFYRRQDENGKYYGDYYLFYASGWREKMAYCTTDNLLTGNYAPGGTLMPVTATSNTNHMAVFDFKGKTYFVYHNGSLPAGNGYRRCACITELTFDGEGKVQPIPETAAGLGGKTVHIANSGGKLLSHANFMNANTDASYPYQNVAVGMDASKNDEDAEWVLTAGKADFHKASYVSVQSENKPGLYLTAGEDGTVTLGQDADAAEETAKRQTFRTVKGLGDAYGISFESVAKPGSYLTVKGQGLCLTDGKEKEAATFFIK